MAFKTMDVSTLSGTAYRFGGFLLEPVQRRLTRGQAEVPLTPTLFDVLAYLVAHPTRSVSKTELLDAIWPDRTVEEANVSQSIYTLRKALAKAGGPAPLIVTATGGYKIAAPVEVLDPGEGRHELTSPVPTTVPKRPPAPALARVLRPGLRPWPLPVWIGLCLGLAACLALGVSAWFWWPTRAPADQPVVVLAGFQNLTTDPLFDKTLATAARIDLMQSPRLKLLQEQKVQDTLGLMTRSPDLPLTPSVAQEVCARNNGLAAISGGLAQFGSKFLLTLTAVNCASGQVLAAEKAEVASRDALLPALDGLVGQLRQQLGESRASVARYSVPLLGRQTSSLEALKAYSEAYYDVAHGKRAEAIPLFKQAIILDPNFAIAHADLGVTYWNLNDNQLGRQEAIKAYALRDTVSEREKLWISREYAEVVTHDDLATIAALKAYLDFNPNDGGKWSDLSNEENWLGRFDDAIRDGRRGLEFDPSSEGAYVVLARAYLHAGQFDHAADIGRRAIAHHVDGDDLHGVLYQLAVAQGDSAAEQKQVVWARGKPGERTMLIEAGQTAFSRGQVRLALSQFQRAMDIGKASGLSDIFSAANARLLEDMGRRDLALQSLGRVAPGYDSADYRFILAAIGDADHARALLRKDLEESPQDTLLHAVSASEIEAALDLRRGAPKEAVAALQPAQPYEYHSYDIPYLKGQAYLAANDPAGAIGEFRKIIDHPGVRSISVHRPLAQLGLARAYRLQGDRAAARSAYQRFLDAWKAADPDMPLLAQARTELAGLGG